MPVMAGNNNWAIVDEYNISNILQTGNNIIAVKANNINGYVGALVELKIDMN